MYDTASNTFVGFALPLDSRGLPIINTYSTKSFNVFEEWCSSLPRSKLLTAHLIQPLSYSSNPAPQGGKADCNRGNYWQSSKTNP